MKKRLYLWGDNYVYFTEMKKNDWKDRLNVVYSTNPDFSYDTGEQEEPETLPKNAQKLRVRIEKK